MLLWDLLVTYNYVSSDFMAVFNEILSFAIFMSVGVISPDFMGHYLKTVIAIHV